MYINRTISVYECEAVQKDGKHVYDKKLHISHDGQWNCYITRRTTKDHTGIELSKYADVTFWTTCAECHEAFVETIRGRMPYAVFADFLEEKKSLGHVRENTPGDWDYIMAELRRWPQ